MIEKLSLYMSLKLIMFSTNLFRNKENKNYSKINKQTELVHFIWLNVNRTLCV